MKRVLLAWLLANFVFIGGVSAILRKWYLAQPPFLAASLELLLIMLPNLALAFIAARRTTDAFHLSSAWKGPLGWTWSGWIIVPVALVGFAAVRGLSVLIGRLVGPSIPYNLPGSGSSIQPNTPGELLGVLLFLLFFVALTVVGEETMFRGLVQDEATMRYGSWAGLPIAAALFGLRHLPADLFYARAWGATPSMWASRQLELYSTAVVLGLARRFGRSTYASAAVHCLVLVTA
jgi:membrane protease YdiL (CAAX protease family)